MYINFNLLSELLHHYNKRMKSYFFYQDMLANDRDLSGFQETLQIWLSQHLVLTTSQLFVVVTQKSRLFL